MAVTAKGRGPMMTTVTIEIKRRRSPMLRNLVVEEYTASARFALKGSEFSKLTQCQTHH